MIIGKMPGTLFLVPTPIGNLGDITCRAVNVLKSVAVIGAEDTRKSAVLLNHYNIKTRTVSYHKFNEKSRVTYFINILKEGKDAAIITDAGTPGISDPAAIIIRETVKQNLPVSALPGATAFVPALVCSSLDCQRFVFIGFLPSGKAERQTLLERISSYPETLIFYESGQRLHRFLSSLRKALGNRFISIGREISKRHETYYRERLEYFLDNPGSIHLKGEFTIVCEGAPPVTVTDEQIKDTLRKYISQGESKSSAVSLTCKDLKTSKNRAYKLSLEL